MSARRYQIVGIGREIAHAVRPFDMQSGQWGSEPVVLWRCSLGELRETRLRRLWSRWCVVHHRPGLPVGNLLLHREVCALHACEDDEAA